MQLHFAFLQRVTTIFYIFLRVQELFNASIIQHFNWCVHEYVLDMLLKAISQLL